MNLRVQEKSQNEGSYQQKILRENKIVQSHHLEYIKQLVMSQQGNPLTVNDVRLRVQEEFGQAAQFSQSTIRRCLKNDLAMSYTKVRSVNPSLLKATSKTKLAK